MRFFREHRVFSVLAFIWLFASLPLAERMEDEVFECGMACFFFSWWLCLLPVWFYIGAYWLGITDRIKRFFVRLGEHLKTRRKLYLRGMAFIFLSGVLILLGQYGYRWYMNKYYMELCESDYPYDCQWFPLSKMVPTGDKEAEKKR